MHSVKVLQFQKNSRDLKGFAIIRNRHLPDLLSTTRQSSPSQARLASRLRAAIRDAVKTILPHNKLPQGACNWCSEHNVHRKDKCTKGTGHKQCRIELLRSERRYVIFYVDDIEVCAQNQIRKREASTGSACHVVTVWNIQISRVFLSTLQGT
jgi:hypothetical protein